MGWGYSDTSLCCLLSHVGGDVWEFIHSLGNSTFREDQRLRAFKNQKLVKTFALNSKVG